MRRSAWAALLGLSCALPLQAGGQPGRPERGLLQQAAGPGPSSGSPEYFVGVGPGGNFTLGCSTFHIAGWNQWEVIEAAAGAPSLFGASLPYGVTGPQLVRSIMDKAVAAGLNVMRAWAHSVDPQYALQTAPGAYSEPIFRGLDYALDQARQRGLKVVLSFVNNWGTTGGIHEYVGWSSTATQDTQFFSDAACQRMYRAHVKAVIGRVNTINGRTYRDDPTIMAWNLINEPRCSGCGPALQAWLATMAPYVKQLDPNHLLSIGSEGFYSAATASRATSDPQGANSWALSQGQDFLQNNALPDIDYATFHCWVDNWLDDSLAFQTRWIQQHAADAAYLRKPAVLEEFGKWVKAGTSADLSERYAFFQAAYQQVAASAAAGGALKGSAFWEFFDQGQVAPAAEGGGAGLYGIRATDAVWPLITGNAATMQGLSAPISGCTASPASLPPAPTCQSTWVNGKPGTGYEGPSCNIDINECVRATAGCAAHAGCTNTPGGFSCECFLGFSGDGQTRCTPTAQLTALNATYVTQGPSQLACSQGSNVAYPQGAPGYVYDPTGSVQLNSATAGGYGSITPVTPQDCQIACEMAQPACTSFAYNPTIYQCFLKAGQGAALCTSPTTSCQEANQDLQVQTFSCGSWQTYFRQPGAGPVAAAG